MEAVLAVGGMVLVVAVLLGLLRLTSRKRNGRFPPPSSPGPRHQSSHWPGGGSPGSTNATGGGDPGGGSDSGTGI